SVEDILDYFYDIDRVQLTDDGKFLRDIDIEKISGQRAMVDIMDPKTGEAVVKAGRRITRAAVKKEKELGITQIEIPLEDLEGKVIARPLIDVSTGEILADANSEFSKDILERCKEAGIKEFPLIFFDGLSVGPYLRNTLLVD